MINNANKTLLILESDARVYCEREKEEKRMELYAEFGPEYLDVPE
jgi:hypothetical protein